MTLLDPQRLFAHAFDLIDRVGDEQQRRAVVFDQVIDASLAFLLEHEVADGQGLVDDEDVGGRRRRDSEGNARCHARRIVLERHVDEVAHFGEVHNGVEILIDELFAVAQQRAVQVDVLASGQLRVEASAQLDERRDGAVDVARTACRLEYAGNDLEHGGLARTVRADDAVNLTAVHGEADVL